MMETAETSITDVTMLPTPRRLRTLNEQGNGGKPYIA
jgi:hypothetical protein